MRTLHVKGIGALVAFGHLALVMSCGISKPPIWLALETAHFEFYREDGLPPACEALGADLEGYLSSFSAYLGVSLPIGGKIIYNHLSSYRYVRELCGGGSDSTTAGCYTPDGDVISSVYAVYPHEIAHVLEHRIGGSGHHPLFLSEGLASMLGGGAPYDRPDHRVDATLPVETLIDDQAFVAAYSVPGSGGGGALYSTAAGFVRYLIDRYGKSAFLDFYGRTRGLTDAGPIKMRFRTLFLDDFDDVVATWRSLVQPIVEDLAPTYPGCDAPAGASAGETSLIDPQCDAAVLRFDVPETGRADLIFDPQGSIGTIELRSCQHGLAIPERDLLLNGTLRLALDVPPGPYEIVASGTPFSVTYASDPVTINVDGRCDGPMAPALVGGNEGDFAVVGRWGSVESTVVFDFLPAAAGRLNVLSVSGGIPGTLPRLFYSNRPVIHVGDKSCSSGYRLPSTWRTDGRIVRSGRSELIAGGRAD